MTDTNLHAKIVALRDDLHTNLLEREDAIEASILALLTGEHVLLLGPPGTGKSLLARSVCQRIDNAAYFERLLTRFSVPEELFGPLSLSALENDRYERITKGSLVDANIAFLDEVFKANSAILNTLLTVMNERVYHEHGASRTIPLACLFAASNETPEDDSLHALYDRFLLRIVVPYLASEQSTRALLTLQATPAQASISLDELAAAQADAQAIPFSDDACEGVLAIKHALEGEGITASDRRWRQCTKLVRAKAWLNADTTTTAEHCDVLTHALWTNPEHARTAERVVAKIANPLHLEAVELEDAAKDLYDQRPDPNVANLTDALEPLLRQLGDIHIRLEQRIHGVPDHRATRANQALVRVEGWHRALSQLALRSITRMHVAPGTA